MEIAGYLKETRRSLRTSLLLTIPQFFGNEAVEDSVAGIIGVFAPVFDAKMALAFAGLSIGSMLINSGINYALQKKIHTTDSIQYTAADIVSRIFLHESQFKEVKVFLLSAFADDVIGIGLELLQLPALTTASEHVTTFVATKLLVDSLIRFAKFPIKGVWYMSPEIHAGWNKLTKNQKLPEDNTS